MNRTNVTQPHIKHEQTLNRILNLHWVKLVEYYENKYGSSYRQMLTVEDVEYGIEYIVGLFEFFDSNIRTYLKDLNCTDRKEYLQGSLDDGFIVVLKAKTIDEYISLINSIQESKYSV